MPDLDAPEVSAALWVAAAVTAAYCTVPWLVTAVGGTRYENGGEEDPAAVAPDGTDPAYTAAYDALRRRGYEPLGPAFMRLTLFMRWWAYRSKVRAFRHRAAGRFAFLHELPEFPGWHQLYFATCWADGGSDLTTGGSADYREVGGGHATAVVAATDAGVVEARHAEREAEADAAGRVRDPDLSLATLLDTTRRRAAAGSRSASVGLAWGELFVLALPACAAAFAAGVAGRWHWAGPAVGLAGYAAYLVVQRVKEARAAAAVREWAATPAGADRD